MHGYARTEFIKKKLHPIINEHVVSGSLGMFYKEKLTGKRIK